MGRPAGWMEELTGRSPMKSPGKPSLRREVEREFWLQIAEGVAKARVVATISRSTIGRRSGREGVSVGSIEATSGQGGGLSSDPLTPPPLNSRKRRWRRVVVVASVLMLLVTLVSQSPAGAASWERQGKWRPSIQNRNTVKAVPDEGAIHNACRIRLKAKWTARDQTAWEVQISTRQGDGNKPYSNPDDERDPGIADAWTGWSVPTSNDEGFGIIASGSGPHGDVHKMFYYHTFDDSGDGVRMRVRIKNSSSDQWSPWSRPYLWTRGFRVETGKHTSVAQWLTNECRFGHN